MEGQLYFVVFCEDGVWVAHGLQHNIVTHGESLQEIRENIDILMGAYARNGDTELEQVPQAESPYWARFVEAYKAGNDLDKYLAQEVSPEPDSAYLEKQVA